MTSFAEELAAQTDLSRLQLADGHARGDDDLVETARARLAELEDLRLLHSPELLPLLSPAGGQW
ncbi:hypothetical protein AB2L28_04290 [Kineococcus sp. TBRC 1896]|uniref:Uncharacterized protein n=1 Tax=Kineococcus mangrovi TaxID=1660183 RepID=A0ABV4HYG1_9ACTN